MISGSTGKLHGTILDTYVQRQGSKEKPRIMANVQWDNGAIEDLLVAGCGMLARYTLPAEQEPIIPFRSHPKGMHYLFDLQSSRAPPLSKLDYDELVPLLIFPKADICSIGEPALNKLL